MREARYERIVSGAATRIGDGDRYLHAGVQPPTSYNRHACIPSFATDHLLSPLSASTGFNGLVVRCGLPASGYARAVVKMRLAVFASLKDKAVLCPRRPPPLAAVPGGVTAL